MVVKIPMKLKRTKRFEGEVYRLADWFFNRAAAGARKDTLRLRGYSARITTRQSPLSVKGYHEGTIYLVWYRRA